MGHLLEHWLTTRNQIFNKTITKVNFFQSKLLTVKSFSSVIESSQGPLPSMPEYVFVSFSSFEQVNTECSCWAHEYSPINIEKTLFESVGFCLCFFGFVWFVDLFALVLWDRDSLCTFGCPGPCPLYQADLDLTEPCLFLSPMCWNNRHAPPRPSFNLVFYSPWIYTIVSLFLPRWSLSLGVRVSYRCPNYCWGLHRNFVTSLWSIVSFCPLLHKETSQWGWRVALIYLYRDNEIML